MRGKKGSGVDWSNIKERRKARRDYQRAYALKYPKRILATRRKYYMAHPTGGGRHDYHICKCGNPVPDVPHLRHKNICYDCHRKQISEYQSTPENHIKIKAQQIFRSYVTMGYIECEPCQICNRKANAHHPDYSKPLLIAWLCPSHHEKLHCGSHYKLEFIDYDAIKQQATEAKKKEFAISKTLLSH